MADTGQAYIAEGNLFTMIDICDCKSRRLERVDAQEE